MGIILDVLQIAIIVIEEAIRLAGIFLQVNILVRHVHPVDIHHQMANQVVHSVQVVNIHHIRQHHVYLVQLENNAPRTAEVLAGSLKGGWRAQLDKGVYKREGLRGGWGRQADERTRLLYANASARV